MTVNSPKDESSQTLSTSFNVTNNQSPVRSQRHANRETLHTSDSKSARAGTSKQNGYNGPTSHMDQLNGHVMDDDVVGDNRGTISASRSEFENEVKKLTAELNKERETVAALTKKMEEEFKLKVSLEGEFNQIKTQKERAFADMKKLHQELNEKISELGRLKGELSQKNNEQMEGSVQNLKAMIIALQKENSQLKMEKDKMEADLKFMKNVPTKSDTDSLESRDTTANLQKVIDEMASSITTMKKTLHDTSAERDKALHDLSRLKQHLLEKEREDSEKMDEDNKTIEVLQANVDQQKAYIFQLEKALKQEKANNEENRRSRNSELQHANATIDDLKNKLVGCMNALESKNIELLNLQAALGQYYAESEAKDRLGNELDFARQEIAKLSKLLELTKQELEVLRREKEEMVHKLTLAERTITEGKSLIHKLEDDNLRLRGALEQNVTRLNRLSLDSDNTVDRRIVIKLLVTYFQRNHSKEVLDLMVRMLGFSEEDKQRVGLAQNNASRGVVRGVLGLPGRLVGGIVGGRTAETPSQSSSDNHSFADLWVDFLLKETEERERRESSSSAPREGENSGSSSTDLLGRPNTEFTNIALTTLSARQPVPSLYPGPPQ